MAKSAGIATIGFRITTDSCIIHSSIRIHFINRKTIFINRITIFIKTLIFMS